MKTETSAGGVLVRKHGNYWYVLLMRDMSGTWTFPKGLIEPDEKPLEAARREIGEEVRLTKLVCMKPLTPVTYRYRRNGVITKHVAYFLFRVTGSEPIVCQKSEGIREAKWVLLKKAINMVGYRETNVSLITQAMDSVSV